MRKSEIFFDAITGIREELIDQALDYRFPKHKALWRRYMGMAACLALVVFVGFNAIRLGIIGGGTGRNSVNNSTADMSAPKSENQTAANDDAAVEAPMESLNSNTDGLAGDVPEESPEPDYGATAASTFIATVLEIHDTWLLVEPAEGEAERSSADRIEVPTQKLDGLPEFDEGDTILITYDGSIQETYPARLATVLKIALAE